LVVWVDADLLHLVHCGVARPPKAIAPARDSIKVSRGADQVRPGSALGLTVPARTDAGFSSLQASPSAIHRDRRPSRSPRPKPPGRRTTSLPPGPSLTSPSNHPASWPTPLALTRPRPPTAATTGPGQASSAAVKALVERAKWERHMMSVSVRRVPLASDYTYRIGLLG